MFPAVSFPVVSFPAASFPAVSFPAVSFPVVLFPVVLSLVELPLAAYRPEKIPQAGRTDHRRTRAARKARRRSALEKAGPAAEAQVQERRAGCPRPRAYPN